MKYVLVLGDGMADEPIKALGDKTPLEVADIPVINALAKKSEIGLVKTVPKGMKPGSDTANLSVLGYAPEKYYSGRSPLEALSIGVELKETDVAIRCNLVTLMEHEGLEYDERRVIDHSSGEISTEEAAELMKEIQKAFNCDEFKYYIGTSYRHLLVWDHGEVVRMTGPHDIPGQVIGPFLPDNEKLKDMMRRSYDILKDHPINVRRKEQGLNPANSIWFWGPGTKPALSPFEEKTGKKGAMISAVDLLKGIAVGAGMEVPTVEGANGGLHTNYEGKARAALEALFEGGCDFAYIHVEAPDEMGHQGNMNNKIKAIEEIDHKVVDLVVKAMEEKGEDFRMLILPDHPTPIAVRTHTSDAVPYLLYDSTDLKSHDWNYNEKEAAASGNYVEVGSNLIDILFDK
ncbi:MAG: cofactor-independent phosphoglycerate mutase [Clostridiales bacterium]|nr:cofactor-independent phosphoglycerate mutase [Clostridiales bacterium]